MNVVRLLQARMMEEKRRKYSISSDNSDTTDSHTTSASRCSKIPNTKSTWSRQKEKKPSEVRLKGIKARALVSDPVAGFSLTPYGVRSQTELSLEAREASMANAVSQAVNSFPSPQVYASPEAVAR
ncbi:protein jade- hypothetical protein [Limosa lapponica baueri]|uniref:Uncharacterized protein n=1 Tax=Limosa lapponica baueri TaxID=1758121 RepID=A0A2I0TBN1_LIMLA|nr:protein jade- hypothetical protein [Limosa lapponica baueri]